MTISSMGKKKHLSRDCNSAQFRAQEAFQGKILIPLGVYIYIYMYVSQLQKNPPKRQVEFDFA